MNLNKFLATELMGWTPQSHGCVTYAEEYTWMWSDENDKAIIDCSNWNPLENIAQAFEVVEKMRIKNYTFFLSLEEYYKPIFDAIFWTETGARSRSGDFNPATAITLAAATIDDRFRGSIYAVPFGTVPTKVTDWAAKLAGVWLYRSRRSRADGDDPGVIGHEGVVLKEIREVNAGMSHLPLARHSNTPSAPFVVGGR